MGSDLNTVDFNIFFALPALVTIIVIIILFSSKRWRALLWKNKLIAGLVITLLLMNLIEVLTFGNIYKNYDLLLRAYYIISIISSSFFLCLSERLNHKEIVPRYLLYVTIILINFVYIYSILYSDLVISGAFRTSYTILRIPGKYYWLFQIFTLFCLIAGTYLIWRSINRSKNPLAKKRRTVILYSFIPIIFTAFLVITLMHFGFLINLSILLPLSTLVFLMAYLFTETRKDLYKFLIYIPNSSERIAYKELNDRVIEYMSKTQMEEQISLKEAMHTIEKVFVTRALKIKDGNHNLAAELLSTSMSTVYRNKDRNDDENKE